jgi:hypothetical protein
VLGLRLLEYLVRQQLLAKVTPDLPRRSRDLRAAATMSRLSWSMEYAARDAQQLASARASGAGARKYVVARVIQNTVRFQDEHMPKIMRALLDLAECQRTCSPG